MPLIIPDSLYSMFSPKEATSISCLAEKYNKGVPLFSLKGEKMSQCVFFFLWCRVPDHHNTKQPAETWTYSLSGQRQWVRNEYIMIKIIEGDVKYMCWVNSSLRKLWGASKVSISFGVFLLLKYIVFLSCWPGKGSTRTILFLKALSSLSFFFHLCKQASCHTALIMCLFL